jgi:hypothetical protein
MSDDALALPETVINLKMTKPRTPIPDDISAEIMLLHDRTCCVCHQRELAVQIHHIDEDPTNHTVSNLAVLCLEHHEQTQVRGGFAKNLKLPMLCGVVMIGFVAFGTAATRPMNLSFSIWPGWRLLS